VGWVAPNPFKPGTAAEPRIEAAAQIPEQPSAIPGIADLLDVGAKLAGNRLSNCAGRARSRVENDPEPSWCSEPEHAQCQRGAYRRLGASLKIS
jgi:hypothetical protein